MYEHLSPISEAVLKCLLHSLNKQTGFYKIRPILKENNIHYYHACYYVDKLPALWLVNKMRMLRVSAIWFDWYRH